MAVLLVAAAVILILAFRIVWLFVFPRVDRNFIPPVSWIDEISADRYSILSTLLDEGSFRLLARGPGCTPEMIARLRSQRYRMFVASLHGLREDFVRTSLVLRFILAHSDADRPELSAVLLRAQWTFAKSFAMARLRAFAWSLGYGTVDVRDLLNAVDGLRAALQSCGLRPLEGAV